MKNFYQVKDWREIPKPTKTKTQRFSFDDEQKRVWNEIFDVLSFVIEKKKFTLDEIKSSVPISRLDSILRNLSDRDNAFIILKRKKDCWYFCGRLS